MRPSTERAPLPYGVVGLVAAGIWRGEVASGRPQVGETCALACMLSFDCLLRISELEGLRTAHVAGSHMGCALQLGVDKPTKTGRDEGSVISLPFLRSWVLRAIDGRDPRSPVLDVPLATFAGALAGAARRLGLSHLTSHVLRHSGATFHGSVLSATDLMLRGRWKNVESVARYCEPHLAIECWSALLPRMADLARRFEGDPEAFLARAKLGMTLS